MTTIEGVGPQLARAQQGTDPRGCWTSNTCPRFAERRRSRRRRRPRTRRLPVRTDSHRNRTNPVAALGISVAQEQLDHKRQLPEQRGPPPTLAPTRKGEATMTEQSNSPSRHRAPSRRRRRAVADMRAFRRVRNPRRPNLRKRVHEPETDLERLITSWRVAAPRSRTQAARCSSTHRYVARGTQRPTVVLRRAVRRHHRRQIVAAAKALAAEKPHLARPNAAPPPSQRPIEGAPSGATHPQSKPAAPTWASAIRGSWTIDGRSTLWVAPDGANAPGAVPTPPWRVTHAGSDGRVTHSPQRARMCA